MGAMTVVGYRDIKGTSKKNGKPYDGCLLFVQYESKDVTGYETDTVFIDRTLINIDVTVGLEIEVLYNKNGFVTELREVGA